MFTCRECRMSLGIGNSRSRASRIRTNASSLGVSTRCGFSARCLATVLSQAAARLSGR